MTVSEILPIIVYELSARPHDQKSKPEVNSRDVIKWMSGTKRRRSQWLYTDISTKFGIEVEHYTINMMKCAKFT